MMTAMFRNRDDAENAYQELLKRGFTRDQISVLMSEETRTSYAGRSTEVGSKAAEGTGVGAAVGGTIGAIVGAIAAIGTSITLPGLGLIVAGPIAGALAGLGAGGATGGLVGALIGAGIPKETVQKYESGLKEGGIVLGFYPRNIIEADEVEQVWQKYNAGYIHR
jgi:hypothetical protein